MKIIVTKLLILGFAFTAHAQGTWIEISTPTFKDLNAIQFVSNQVGYVSGDSVLLKTVDSGATWTQMMLDSIPHNINQTLDILDMHWFDENHGYIMAGPWGGFYETLDGGLDWEYTGTANAGFCQTSALFFFDDNNGFAGGAGCFEGHIIDRFESGLWSTTNDPNDWDSQNWVTCIEFANASFGLAGTINGTLLRTTDGGLNWDTISNLAGDSAITDFIFYPDGTIRATHQNNPEYGVMISEDDGLTWEFDSELASFFYPSMNAAHIDDNGTTYIAGETFNEGLVFDSNASFWNMVTVGHPINDIASHSDSVTFLVGDSGAIYTNYIPGTIGLADITESPTFQISPNPASNELNISGVEGIIKIVTVFDSSGRLVMQESGSQTTQYLDVSRLESGVFILEVETEKGVARKEFVKY